MNERIRELADLAFKFAFAETNTDNGIEFHVKYNQKFAELIVRECGEWVNDNLGLLDEEAQADLLKHFGVEE
jgi:hypothetical protein